MFYLYNFLYKFLLLIVQFLHYTVNISLCLYLGNICLISFTECFERKCWFCYYQNLSTSVYCFVLVDKMNETKRTMNGGKISSNMSRYSGKDKDMSKMSASRSDSVESQLSESDVTPLYLPVIKQGDNAKMLPRYNSSMGLYLFKVFVIQIIDFSFN